MCPEKGETIAFNFLRQTSFVCSGDLLRLLDYLSDWRATDTIAKVLQGYSDDDIRECLNALVEMGGVVVQGSAEHEAEARKVEKWEWGIPSAMLHYCEQNRRFVSRNEAETIQMERAKERPEVDLYTLNTRYDEVTPFPNPLGKKSVLDLMARRRTVREVEQVAIAQEALSDCLFAGLGITSQTENCVNRLPLSMTPSGGARNPYEGYVYVREVEGLEPGFYHYSAMEHSLGLISRGSINDAAGLVGDQPWVGTMSAIVFLCADFSRTMWKYQDNNAYRVVLIEAGHIGQNIMLAATEHGLTACPSAALSHDRIADHLQLDHDLQAPVYALMIGKPADVSAISALH